MVRWFLYPVGDDNYLVVVAAGIALALLLALGPARARTTKRRRGILVAIRAVVIVMVLLAMLRPTLVMMESRRQSADLIVLSDGSRSMQVHDETNGASRWEALRSTVDNARGAFEAVGKDVEVKAYTFDEDVRPAPVSNGKIDLPDTPNGQQTAIGYALEEVLRQEAGKRVLGIILLSDGAQRAYPPRDVLPQTVAGRLKDLGEPLYAVRFGQRLGLGQSKDVAVTELLVDPTVFVKNELAIAAQVRINGYVNNSIQVELVVETPSGEKKTVAQQTVKATSDGQQIPLKFSYVPEDAGEYKLTLKLAAQQEEMVIANNQMSTFVQALKGGIKVLYVEGFPGRQEYRYLEEALKASPDVNVENVLLRAPASDDRPTNFGERFKPAKYDVYILGNVDASAFEKQELTDLANTVEKGAGLIMIGGLRSFGPGGWGDTPLAQLLPVTMGQLEKTPLGATVPKDLHISGAVKIRPTDLGLKSFLRLAATPRESAEIWNRLPSLKDGANKFSGLKEKSALVLAASDKGQPLLVEHEYGAGRVIAFAGDSTWRWRLHGFDGIHKRLWRQVILWLAKKDESTEGNVWIKLAQRRVLPGQRIEFAVGARSPSGEAVADAAFQVEVEMPGGKKSPLNVARGNDETSGSFRETAQAGDYVIRVTATRDGKELGAARARFLVVEQDLELDNPVADATFMENLSAMSGGKAILPEELPALIRQLAESTEELEVQTETKKTFWDTWPFFLVLVGLLAAEWFLRKRWGLV
jgi:hypothetical protein